MNETIEDTKNVAEENTEIKNSKLIKAGKEVLKPRKLSTSTLLANNSVISAKEIDQKLSEHIVKGEEGVYSCGYCGKQGDRNVFHMRNHVETHMEGLSFPCQSCEKTFRSRNSLSVHNVRYHRY